MKTPIKNNLKEYRLKARLLQREVAEKIDIKASDDRVCRWENGRSMPSVKNLNKMCWLYGVCLLEVYPEE